jgi:hypothetical protein
MKRFKVQFLKIETIKTVKQGPTMIAEQEYTTDSEKIDIIIPQGYGIIAITEFLPAINQCKNETTISNIKRLG